MLHVSMERRGQVCRGFTIIELIVVVGIIALLIALLMPAVGSARETARTALCASNMRQMGQIVMNFATTHDNRGPGQDNHELGALAGNHVLWWQTLNAEVVAKKTRFGSASNPITPDNPSVPYGISDGQTSLSVVSSKTLSCPNFVRAFTPTGADVINVPFAINFDLIGGWNSTGAPAVGVFGIPADPKMGGNEVIKYDRYSLGAKVTAFRSDQFMIVENENEIITSAKFSGYIGYATTGPGHVTLGSQSDAAGGYLPVYSGGASDPGIYNNTGNASFRHPYSRRGNFLYIDGHVETLTPNNDILSPRRYGLGASQ
jgi:prepilin-type N-terminal cleavage/methylation domain-containing protein/prepilin-type processing-associated H-X9-DG protein